MEEFIIPFDITNINGDEIKIRLSYGSGYFKIKDINIDSSVNENVEIIKLDLLSATKNNDTDVLNIVNEKNNNVILTQGEHIDFIFETDEELADYVVDFTGYFYSGGSTYKPENINELKDLSANELIEYVLNTYPDSSQILNNLMDILELLEYLEDKDLNTKIELFMLNR